MTTVATQTEEFIVEIGTEELPPTALRKLAESFSAGIKLGLNEAELSYGTVSTYASPRRLAVKIEQLQLAQADKTVERKGPAKKAAFDADGNATKALQGFARGCGVEVAELSEIETPKGIWMVYYLEQKGKQATELLEQIVSQSLAKLPIPKRMRWGDSSVEFVRPVHWVMMLLGQQIVPATILGKKTSNTSRGHRFHAPNEVVINSASSYVSQLETSGYVIVDMDKRKKIIASQVEAAAKQAGGTAVIDKDLLEEVSSLNEWPSAIVGDFDESFLSVPAEALISAMKGHQKYFHMVDDNNKLMAKFITISNIESSNPESVKYGNERVIRPRLADAKFFWEQDLKQGLDSFLPRLAKVVFQKKLGSVLEKTERLQILAVKVGQVIGANEADLKRAAKLSKSDLMSEMVGEFPNLQGLMGSYYAREQGETEAVACAIKEQYLPRFAGDALPEQTVAQSLAIADKLDTITGIFGLGQVPTGDKDPFALRRSALGLMRIIIEKNIDVDLKDLITFSVKLHQSVSVTDELINNIFNFIMSRLKAYYADKEISTEQFEAVYACLPNQPLDFDKRIKAVKQFASMPEAESLSAANKRIANILKKAKIAKFKAVDANLFELDAEKDLFNTIQALSSKVLAFTKAKDYTSALQTLASIKQPVDTFFDEVMVMAEDEAVKQNRLAMLESIYSLFINIADISRL
ncbi:MAG TPA: glycine--tRNA ligase subunit beta [Thiomicrospira sp.]|jgi:glycyl-tRNA synthetase beta chain|nr:glycine--tRNA ligase subunit beta [Thiomicrospira sp.]